MILKNISKTSYSIFTKLQTSAFLPLVESPKSQRTPTVIFQTFAEAESNEVWNKRTIKSKKFESLVSKQLSQTLDEELSKPLPLKNFDNQRFTFLILQSLQNKQLYSHLAYNSIQTIGHIKIDDGFWLHSLSDLQEVRIKLIFTCNKIWKDSVRDMYAQIYGCCKFYENEEKKMLNHPDDCTSRPYMEFVVYAYINLYSYKEARILEKDLYDKSYTDGASLTDRKHKSPVSIEKQKDYCGYVT